MRRYAKLFYRCRKQCVNKGEIARRCCVALSLITCLLLCAGFPEAAGRQHGVRLPLCRLQESAGDLRVGARALQGERRLLLESLLDGRAIARREWPASASCALTQAFCAGRFRKVDKSKRIPGKAGQRYYKNIGLGFKTPKEAIEGAPQRLAALR